jgi:beta-lactamase class A
VHEHPARRHEIHHLTLCRNSIKTIVHVFDRMEAAVAGSCPMTARKITSLALLVTLIAGCSGGGHPRRTARPAPTPSFARLEQTFHARLGLFAVDTGSGRTVAYRADERFAHCSTFKALAVGVLLKRVPGTQLDQVVHYRSSDLVSHAPVTSQHVSTGMTLRALSIAALQVSDNTAANLISTRLGGPQGLQAALRGLGDQVTNVDRTEPGLNTATPGDTRDTSTPRALATDLRGLVLGDLLPAGPRGLLTGWLLGNTTGGPYVRAGVPSGWKVGDKTGTGGYGTRNDIAVAWPPTGAPVVISVLSDRGRQNAPSNDALIADATRQALAALGRG